MTGTVDVDRPQSGARGGTSNACRSPSVRRWRSTRRRCVWRGDDWHGVSSRRRRAQVVRLTQSGRGTVTWTATSNQPWLQVSPASGSGSANLSVSVVSVAGLPVGGTRDRGDHADVHGCVEHARADRGDADPHPEWARRRSPFGVVDTPLDNTHRRDRGGAVHGLGARRHRGDARDDLPGGGRRRKWRRWIRTAAGRRRSSSALPCSSTGRGRMWRRRIRHYPLNTRAGWGFMVLTNMLPSQGNGTYRVLHVCAGPRGAHDAAGDADDDVRERERDEAVRRDRHADAGRRGVGGELRELRVGADAAAEDDSDRRVDDHGAGGWRCRSGPVDYNHERPDIEALFPGFQNTAGRTARSGSG